MSEQDTKNPGLKTILGDDFFHLQRAIAHEVQTKGGAESLLVSGEAELSVTYRVQARVRVKANDVEISSFRPIRVVTEGDWQDPSALVIRANESAREHLDENEVEDLFFERVADDIPEDLDDYNVEIDYVEYDDHVVDSWELDEESLEAIENWNSKAEEETAKDD